MKTLAQLAVIALVVYWVSSAFGWDFWTLALVVGVLWGVYHLSRHFGWFGLTPAPTRTAGGGITAGMTKFVIGFTTLTFVMMVGTKVVGVSNNFAFTYLLGWGSRPWLYPQATTDILIWVSLLFLSAVIAILAPNGRVKPALWVFGITLLFLFVAREMPRTAEAVRPKPSTPIVGSPTKWEDADASIAEGRGSFPVAVETAKKAVVGDNVAKRTGGLIRETVGGFWEGLFPPSPKPAVTPVTYVSAPVVLVTQKVGPTLTFHPFDSSSGCYETDLGYEARWSPDKGTMRVYDPAGGSHVETLGKPSPKSAFGPGHWGFCAEGPDPATGVVIWE